MNEVSREIARWSSNNNLTLLPHASRLRCEVRDLVSADGHRIDVAFSLGVKAVDRAADRNMLLETFAKSPEGVVRDADVAAHLNRPLASAAMPIVASMAANDLLSDAHRQALRDVLIATSKSATFAWGMEALAPFEIEARSPTIEQQRRAELARSAESQQFDARRDRLRQAAGALDEFNRLRANAPDVPAGTLLERIDAANPAGLLETLLRGAAERAGDCSIWLTVGTELVEYTPATSAVARRIQLPESLGPARSVSTDQLDNRPVLLIGARSGVTLVAPQTGELLKTFDAPAHDSQLGFNRAVLFNGELLATHRDLGLTSWDLGNGSLQSTPGDFTAARNLAVLDGRLSFTREATLLQRTATGETTELSLPFAPLSVTSTGESLTFVADDGSITLFDRTTATMKSHMGHARRLSSATLMPWLDESRLLLATSDGPIECVGLQDAVRTEFRSLYTGVRHLCANARYVVGLSEDRQRVIGWDVWDGRAPAFQFNAAQQLKHRVADLCLL